MLLHTVCLLSTAALSCTSIEYTIASVRASKAIAGAEAAGANCTEEQLDKLSPVRKNQAPDPGTEIISSEDEAPPDLGAPKCSAPFEYYSAVEYQKKAREEVSYSEYGPAVEYSRKAQAMAKDARDIALKREAERGR